jgi:succinyl-CoA synthetase beta subunit
MDIHEYQAKEILAEFGVPIPPFAVISSIDDVQKAIDDLHLKSAVLKVQVHAGGRGKAGGVKIAKTPEEVRTFAKQMLGMRLVTKQTTQSGVVANQLILSPLVQIQKEYYLGVVIDRKKGVATLIASPEGGVEIEEVAEKTPEKILTLPIELSGKIAPFRLIQLAKFMGWKDKTTQKEGIEIAKSCAQAFVAYDASLVEINPLVLTNEGHLVALDAKVSVDDNALFRQQRIKSFYDPSQLNLNERLAKEYDLAYIALDGNIGCMVNGAGLAMATMDLIQHHGGKPANFLDVGGGATAEKVTEGFKIILSDKQVKAILVNIFGGIMNCQTIAEGIVAASKELDIHVPLVVRMEGTNVEMARKTLDKSGLNIIVAKDLTEAAKFATGALS